MTSPITINGSNSVNYLVHGMDLLVEVNYPSAWLISLKYKVPSAKAVSKRDHSQKTRRYWIFRRGIVHSVVNKHATELHLVVWTPLPKRISIPLKVDVVNISKVNNELCLPRPRIVSPVHPNTCMTPHLRQPSEHMRIGKVTAIVPFFECQVPWGELDQKLI